MTLERFKEKWGRINDPEDSELVDATYEIEADFWNVFNTLQKDVTRVEVINHQDQPIGRVYTKYGCENVELQFQDEGRTLKIFISKE